jgi:hypothetical protein
MAGTSYTRQSTLTDGSLITAALFNDEYNQILNAFVYSSTGTTGHTHDGSAGQGGAIAKIGDQDFKNKIEISSTNNRIECYIEVSGSPVEQLRIQDGAILPVTDSDIDLGTTSLRFKDAFVDSLTVTGVVTATGFTIGSAVITEAELEILDGKTFLDEDDLVSDSATGIPSQQSVKAYVDAQVTAQDLDLTDGTTSISIDLDSEALSVLGGTGITSTASGNGVTLAIDSTVATLTGTQTLTNKTLTSPDVNGGTIDGAVIGGTAAAAGSFTTIDATGNITVGGTVDGRDVAADGTKLDGIETAATADQTASEIRALVEAATDSNVFTDADHGKLNGIEASATADQTDAEIRAAVEAATDSNVFTDADHSKLNAIEASADVTDTTNVTAAGALMDSEVTNLAQVKAFDSSDYATAAQGTTAEDALPKSGGAMTGAITTNSTFDGRDVATDGTKLDGIEASADVTDTTNVTAAGALMDSELTAIASVKALNQGVATTDSPSFVNLTLSGTGSVKVPSGTTAQRDGSPVNGMFRYNSSNEQFEGYQSGDWGAIGGGGGSNTFTADTFTANGSTTAYALSQVINSENNLLVFIDGVFQQQSAYSIATASGTTTLTFSTAPANTREIIVYSVASAVSGSNLNTDSMTGDGSDVTLALSIAPVSENNTQVFIDGVYQNKDTYSISGTTLTFSTAPPAGSAVEVMTMTQTEVNVPVDGTITSAKLSGDLVTPSNLTVTGTASATNVSLPDDGVLSLGTSDELTLKHHNSGYSHLINTTGTLYVDSDSVTFRDDDGSPSNMVISQTGIDVTGSIRGTQLEAYKTNHGGDVSVAANQLGNAYLNLASTASLILGATATSTINSTKIVADHSGGATNNHVQDLVFYPVGGNSQNFEAMRISSLGALTVKNVANGHTVFNENGVDADFRVESDNNANMLFVDGGLNKVGIGVVPVEGALTIKSAGNSYATSALVLEDADSTTRSYITHVNGDLAISNNGSTDQLVITASGAATFSSSVTATDLNITSNTPIIKFIESDQSNKQYQLGSYGSAFAIYDSNNSQFRYVLDTNGNHIFNEGGVDADFRVESDGNANMLFVDAGSETVCIGHNATNPTVPNIVFDARNMVQAGQSFYQGLVASTQNNNNGFISLFNLTTAAANTVGCVFDGTLIVHSYTGFSRVRFTASRYFTNSAIAFSVADTQDGTGSAGGVHLSLVTATVGSESFLGVQKTGGGTGTSYIDAFVSGMMEIKETTSGSYTVTATHGTLIT